MGYSKGFREKVVATVKSGTTTRIASKQFKVAEASIRNWVRNGGGATPTQPTAPVVNVDLLVHSLRTENSRIKLALADLYLSQRQ